MRRQTRHWLLSFLRQTGRKCGVAIRVLKNWGQWGGGGGCNTVLKKTAKGSKRGGVGSAGFCLCSYGGNGGVDGNTE